jgi:hypothetical protein
MSMPSVEDDVWQYWLNEVEANCPTQRDKYRMAYKALEFKCFADENKPSRDHIIQTLIDDYLEHADMNDLIHLIADAIRDEEIDYD